jgi:hypothetical protein
MNVQSAERHKVVDEVFLMVDTAATQGLTVFPVRDAIRLLRENPGCGLTESEIAKVIAKLARDKHVAIQLAPISKRSHG